MKKKAFTILELALIVAMLGLIFGMTRNFFNVGRQKKIIFGETCLNYIYGEVDKFQTDIKYGKLPLTVSGVNGVYSLRFYGVNTGTFQHSSGGMAGLSFEGLGDDFATVKTYKHIPLSSKNYVIFNNNSIPEPCYDELYTLVSVPQISAGALQVTIPAVRSNNTKWFIGEDWETNSDPRISAEVLYSVCSLPSGQKNPIRGAYVPLNDCIQIGKISIDRRSETINFLKCAKTNEQTGICSLRPRLN